jgi:hypothetical protein
LTQGMKEQYAYNEIVAKLKEVFQWLDQQNKHYID